MIEFDKVKWSYIKFGKITWSYIRVLKVSWYEVTWKKNNSERVNEINLTNLVKEDEFR